MVPSRPRRKPVEPSRRRGRLRLASRTAWGVTDQAISSLTNFGLGVLVARSVSVREFGAFALTFAAYAVVVNVGNGLISEPFLVRYSNVPEGKWRQAAATASGAALVLGVISSLVCVIVAIAVSGSVGGGFLALSLTLPGLVVQDTWRSLFFARRRGSMAFGNDVAWAAAFFPVTIVLFRTEAGTVFSLLSAWGAAGSFAAVVGCIQAKILPKPLDAWRWLSDQRSLATRFLAELMLWSGAQHLTIYGIGAVAGLEAVGGLRGAEMLLGPLYVLIVGVRIMAVPEAIAASRISPERMRRKLLWLALVMAFVAVATGTAAALLPPRVGMAILGATWAAARPALVPVALFMAALSAAISATIGLRALAAPKRSLRAQMYAAPLVLAGGVTGAVFGSAAGGGTGMAIGMWLGAAIWWRQLGLASREPMEGRGHAARI